jgi:hypothetical protein
MGWAKTHANRLPRCVFERCDVPSLNRCEASMVALLISPLGRAGLAVAGVLVFLGWFAFDQQSKGAAKVVAKIERQDNASASNIRKADAGSRSATRGVRGAIRDPNTAAE